MTSAVKIFLTLIVVLSGVLTILLFVLFLVISPLFPVERHEVARVRSPSGSEEAVLYEVNGGATTSFDYRVFVVKTGDTPGLLSRLVVALYGARRNSCAYGVTLKWVDDGDRLRVEYLTARNVSASDHGVIWAGRAIHIELRDHVNDDSAPCGGMYYNLKRARQLSGQEMHSVTTEASRGKR